ncbi:oligosaccharide flippase family protein [Alkalicoccus urumqiensis]|uniref:Uncharacterized protein n=1 Tax=Alkalicoccus urumqiensis TaxID=1548213 RepID=A0A2P6MDR0_ALKUR|nr:oligosaccharide flippase family protein [Alkalicoccus urumqiensis]PRO64396.1 hypothetical protein C6I21_14980 [Alkalicoccus urumqiensis]
MTEQKRAGGWLASAAVLSAAALAAKGLSAVYKVPYQQLTGDLGFYVYQQVYPLYGLVLVIGTYGIPLVIASAVQQKKDSAHLLAPFYFRILFLLFAALGILLLVQAPVLAGWMGDDRLTPALRLMGLPFFFLPAQAVWRGMAQGEGRTMPTALSQVSEQLVRVIVILAAAWTAMAVAGPYAAGLSAGIGAAAGGAVSLIVLKRSSAFSGSLTRREPLPPHAAREAGKLLWHGFLVSAGALLLVLLQLVDAFTLVNLLAVPDAVIAKGTYDRGWPLIQTGAVVTTVFSYAAVPVVAFYAAAGDPRAWVESARAVKFAVVFGSAASAGLAVIMPWLNPGLFQTAAAQQELTVLSLSVLPAAVFMTSAALLHAAGRTLEAAAVLGAALAVKGVLQYALVPVYGVMGAAWATTLAASAAGAGGLLLLWRKLPGVAGKRAMMAAASLAGMGAGARVTASATASVLPDLAAAVLASAVGACLYIVLLWYLRVFTEEEWQALPKLPSLLPYRSARTKGER